MILGDAGREGVITAVPGSTVRAERYTSRDAVPLLKRANARQLGAAGFWYVPSGDTPSIAWDKATDAAWAAADKLSNKIDDTLDTKHGILGVFSKLLGIPYPLSVLLVLFIGYALLRGAGLVPPVSGIVK